MANVVGSDSSSEATAVRFAVIESIAPKTLSKTFGYSNGQLTKEGGGKIYQGRVKVVCVADVHAFKAFLLSLKQNQALCNSLPSLDEAVILTKDAYNKAGQPENTITRSAEHFAFANGQAGILTLDCDEMGYTAESLLALLHESCPEFATASVVTWPSASSLLYRDGVELTPAKGWRVYVLVSDAGDIPRAMSVLLKRLWLMDRGHIALSKSGALLTRNVFDPSMGQPSRLDFAAGAVCRDGVEQRRGEPRIMSEGKLLDTAVALPDLSVEDEREYEQKVRSAKAAKEAEALTVRGKYVEERAQTLARQINLPDPDEAMAEARDTMKRAFEGHLYGHFEIKLDDDEFVSVAKAIDNPDKYHNRRCYDPIEPDYDGGRVVGILKLYGGRAVLYSHAHGGQTYRLNRQPAEIVLVKGDEHNAAVQVARVVRKEIYRCGGSVGIVSNGELKPLTPTAMRHLIAGRCKFVKNKPTFVKGKLVSWVAEPESCPDVLAKTLVEWPTDELIETIEGVRSAPIMLLNGTMVQTPGMDKQSKWFLDFQPENWPAVPTTPTHDQLRSAMQRIWHPVSQFPYINADDCAVALALIFTSAFRPVLERAPAGAADAPVQGTGKTKLVTCIGMLGAGPEGYRVMPFAQGMNDEEIRKRIATVVKSGVGAWCIDNVMGTFNSGALASYLTAESAKYSDRNLGVMGDITGSHRQLFLITGNNLLLRGELPRRVLVCRLDPRCENPVNRAFNFDPVSFVKGRRLRLLADVYTVYRGWLQGGKSGDGKTLGSYEQWSDMRHCAMWAGQFLDIEFGDPIASLQNNVQEDPEREDLLALLKALRSKFDAYFTANEVAKAVNLTAIDLRMGNGVYDVDEALHGAVRTVVRGEVNSHSVGQAFRFRRGRLAGGLKLMDAGKTREDVVRWHIVAEHGM